jgi:hypothetical protein
MPCSCTALRSALTRHTTTHQDTQQHCTECYFKVQLSLSFIEHSSATHLLVCSRVTDVYLLPNASSQRLTVVSAVPCISSVSGKRAAASLGSLWCTMSLGLHTHTAVVVIAVTVAAVCVQAGSTPRSSVSTQRHRLCATVTLMLRVRVELMQAQSACCKHRTLLRSFGANSY